MFTRSDVIAFTNKHTDRQTDAAENIQRFSLRYDVGKDRHSGDNTYW